MSGWSSATAARSRNAAEVPVEHVGVVQAPRVRRARQAADRAGDAPDHRVHGRVEARHHPVVEGVRHVAHPGQVGVQAAAPDAQPDPRQHGHPGRDRGRVHGDGAQHPGLDVHPGRGTGDADLLRHVLQLAHRVGGVSRQRVEAELRRRSQRGESLHRRVVDHQRHHVLDVGGGDVLQPGRLQRALRVQVEGRPGIGVGQQVEHEVVQGLVRFHEPLLLGRVAGVDRASTVTGVDGRRP
ncbi:hypothetical protein QLR68_14365 [Micromonospora sp. DH15]|nr:hypothetical protein [Micromonospora sp. DH15]